MIYAISPNVRLASGGVVLVPPNGCASMFANFLAALDQLRTIARCFPFGPSALCAWLHLHSGAKAFVLLLTRQPFFVQQDANPRDDLFDLSFEAIRPRSKKKSPARAHQIF